MIRLLSLLLVLAATTAAHAQADETIRLNQTGMYPNQEKVAVVEAAKVKSISIKDASTGKVVVKNKVLRKAVSPWSGKQRTVVDFSNLTTPGQYVFSVNGHEQPFIVKENALQELTTAAIKSYYLMRSGCEIEEKYAGEYARPFFVPFQFIETFLERIVIPRSRSRSLASSTWSELFCPSRKSFPASIILSTRVVLPWSTWAIMAMFLISCIFFKSPNFLI